MVAVTQPQLLQHEVSARRMRSWCSAFAGVAVAADLVICLFELAGGAPWATWTGRLFTLKIALLLAIVALVRVRPVRWEAAGAAGLLVAGVIVLMGRIPPPKYFEPTSIAQNFLGFDVTRARGLATYLADWRPNLLFITFATVAIGGYLLAVRRLHRRGDRWPVCRTVSWVLGWLVVAVSTSSGMGPYAGVEFSVHMALHMTLNMLGPILMVLGGVVTLLLRATTPHPRGTVDTSPMTGESMPLEVGPGDGVLGGTTNLTGRLVVRADAVGERTRLAQMAAIADEAQRRKSRAQKVADRVTSYFVPSVIVVAIAVGLAWWAFGATVDQALANGVAVLIIACPCALGLATPTALMVGVGRGGQLGILIKGHDALEMSGRIDTSSSTRPAPSPPARCPCGRSPRSPRWTTPPCSVSQPISSRPPNTRSRGRSSTMPSSRPGRCGRRPASVRCPGRARRVWSPAGACCSAARGSSTIAACTCPSPLSKRSLRPSPTVPQRCSSQWTTRSWRRSASPTRSSGRPHPRCRHCATSVCAPCC
ncbi:hypothetical protein HJ588_16660 [Flexivirga sp. ID2601S]|uniref:P-type ATPase A domain-containing protein n=1 Tax=Flexivirga aerilata TaxID=1656889 RepID=A0A849ANC2_9MICO|nr:hypothetical protein [Flexivirga aerilata]